MRNAIIGALLIAAVSTLGDFVWAGLHLRHRVGYGLAHGAILFLCIGAYLRVSRQTDAEGRRVWCRHRLAAAGSFYVLAPVAGYSMMFFIWAFVWIALASWLAAFSPPPNAPSAPGAPGAPNSSVVLRGVLAMVGSGLGFYLISGIWRPFDPRGWDYAVHFLSWTIAYLPGFLALLALRKRSHL